MNTWVIGNGQSRKGFALNQLKDFTIGCNAIHRDFTCKSFVAVDMRMVDEILRNEENLGIPIYTRQDWIENYTDQRVRPLPDLPFDGPNKSDKPFHWNSGPYALLLAAKLNAQTINMLGFDLWSSNGLVNNLYKDTNNYANSDSRKVNPDFWIYQIGRLMDHYSNIHFIQHQHTEWRIPDQWKKIKNLTINYFSV